MRGENGDVLITIIGIIIAVFLMLFVPLMAVANNQEDVAQLAAQEETQEFVNKIATKGTITQDDLDTFLQSLSKDGNSYEFEIEVQILDENPGKKASVTSGDLIGENIRYSEFTQAILENIANSSDGKYKLKKGDNIIIRINNTNTTLAQLLRNFAYKVVGKDTYQIGASASAMVQNNGK